MAVGWCSLSYYAGRQVETHDCVPLSCVRRAPDSCVGCQDLSHTSMLPLRMLSDPQSHQKTPGYCWSTPTCRNLGVQDAVFEGKKAEDTSPRKSTPRTLKYVDQQYPDINLVVRSKAILGLKSPRKLISEINVRLLDRSQVFLLGKTVGSCTDAPAGPPSSTGGPCGVWR